MHKRSEHPLSVVSNLANDRLSVLRVFLDAAALDSFSAAGRQHGISPAAASASMQKLDAALNVTLFERTTRQLRLTEEGQLYQYYCQQALALINEAEASLQVRGTIKISAPSDIGRKVLLGFLDEFRQRHPEVQFSLMLSNTPANLVQDDIDIAIHYGQLPDSDRVARQLPPNCRVVCAAPALLARIDIQRRASHEAVADRQQIGLCQFGWLADTTYWQIVANFLQHGLTPFCRGTAHASVSVMPGLTTFTRRDANYFASTFAIASTLALSILLTRPPALNLRASKPEVRVTTTTCFPCRGWAECIMVSLPSSRASAATDAGYLPDASYR